MFSFPETSFEKQCHKGLTRVVQRVKVASRIGQVSTQPHYKFARVANWHVLNVAKNGGTAKDCVSCNEAIQMFFWETGERTISCFIVWSISAYAIVSSFHRK